MRLLLIFTIVTTSYSMRFPFFFHFFRKDHIRANIIGESNRIFYNFPAYVKDLRTKGVDLNRVEIGGRRLITWAIEIRSLEVLRLLLAKKTDCNFVFRQLPNGPLLTPLSFAFAKRNFFQRRFEQNPGALTAIETYDKMIELLLARGARDPIPEDGPKWAKDLLENRRAPVFSGKLNERGDEAGEYAELVIMGQIFKFRWIPSGEFQMGSPETEKKRRKDEILHRVRISHGFWALETPVTQEKYLAVTGKNQGSYLDNSIFEVTEETKDYPVDGITWGMAKEFCGKLNKLSEGRYNFRLPTEAEWEYMCRCGTSTPFSFGKTHNGVCAASCGADHYGKLNIEERPIYKVYRRPCPVRSFPPNQWNLWDMHGNIWEWVEDWYAPYQNVDGVSVDPLGVKTDDNLDAGRVFRGGSFLSPCEKCRSAYRDYERIDTLMVDKGFRVVVSPVEINLDFDEE